MPDDSTPQSSIVLYQTEDGHTRIQCRFENETIWLTQALIAELFEVTPQNVTQHLKAIHKERELDQTATCKDYLQVPPMGQAAGGGTTHDRRLAAARAANCSTKTPRRKDTKNSWDWVRSRCVLLHPK